MQKKYVEGIRIGKYILKAEPIGKGAYGTVYLAKNENNIIFAAKRLDIVKLKSNPQLYDKFVSEIKLYHKLRNEHIIKIYDIKRSKTHVYLFLEYCDCETLTSFVKNYKLIFKHDLPSVLLQFFTRQIVDGMAYMAKKNCMHRDLKLDNIMLTQTKEIIAQKEFNSLLGKHNDSVLDNVSLAASLLSYNVKDQTTSQPINWNKKYISNENQFNELIYLSTIKLIDLGLAKELDSDGRTGSLVGSPFQIAPELWEILFNKNKDNLTKTKYTKMADLWSLGCTLYELAFGSFPFHSNTNEKIYNMIKAGVYKIERNESNVTVEFVDLINGILKIDPQKRYDYEIILNHPFLVMDAKDLTPVNWAMYSSKVIILNANDYTTTFINKGTIKAKEVMENKEEELRKKQERVKEEELEKYIDYQFYDDNCSLIEYETFIEEWEDWVIVSLKSN